MLMIQGNGLERGEKMQRSLFLVLLILLSLCPLATADTSGRSCSATGDPSVDHITLSPSGPISMPADQALNITAIAYNSGGTELNVAIAWSSSSGSIQNFGGGQARWSPQTVGPQTVTACNGNVQTTLDVNVQPGAPLTFELTVSQTNVTADETLEVTPLLRDQYGNGWIPNIPFVNWELPEGVGITLPNDGSSPTLTPGPVGSMTVSVDWGDWTGSVTFNVTKGAAVDIIIEHDSVVVSSDDLVDLCARYIDQRGNTWGVETTWSTFGGLANDALSSFNGECIVFDAGPIGDWAVEIDDQNGMTDSLTLTVQVGKLAHVSLDGLSAEMHIGDFYLLEAEGFDAAGNIVAVDGWNWSVTDGPSTDSIVPDGDGITFVPDRVGQHTIQVMAAGRVQAIDVEVHSGIPVELEIEIVDWIGSTPPSIVTGSSLDLVLYGVDQNGNRNPVDVPIDDWFVHNNFGTIENASAGGTGHYTYTSGGIGDVSITVFLDQAQGTLLVQVLGGPLDYLEVSLPPEGNQGATVEFEISGFDVSGNPVMIHQCSATITTDAGDAKCDENGWRIDLKESGELIVHARIQSSSGSSAEGSDFITVHSTWFGWGNNTQVIIGFSTLIIMIICAILVILSKHLSSRIDEEIELIREETEEQEESPVLEIEKLSPNGVFPPPQHGSAVNPVPAPLPAPAIQPVATISAPNPIPEPVPVAMHTPVPVAPAPTETIPQQVAPIENVEEDWAIPEPEPEPEPEAEIQADDEWGEMAGDWNQEDGTLTSAAANFAQIQHENRRADGPRDVAEQTLRPLPGTVAGDDGWYFDREGRPSHWKHSEENGWTQE